MRASVPTRWRLRPTGRDLPPAHVCRDADDRHHHTSLLGVSNTPVEKPPCWRDGIKQKPRDRPIIGDECSPDLVLIAATSVDGLAPVPAAVDYVTVHG